MVRRRDMFFYLLMISVVSTDQSVDPADQKCYERPGINSYEAHCGYRNLDSVPQDLDSRISFLDLSHNRLTTLQSDSFIRYEKLKRLKLHDNNLDTIAEDAFVHQTNLVLLDLEFNNGLTRLPELPPSLATLSLSGNRALSSLQQNNDNFANLNSLESLTMQKMNFQRFPRLSSVGKTLTTLDMVGNPKLTNFSVADLAPLCKLKTLQLGDNKKNNSLKMTNDKCACSAVKEWMQKYDIGGTEIVCSKESDCSKIDSAEFESVRSKCMWSSRMNIVRSKTFIICTIVAVILISLLATYCIFRYKKKKNNRTFTNLVKKYEPSSTTV